MADATPPTGVDAEKTEKLWQSVLVDGHTSLRVLRKVFRLLPADPRCKVCVSPFAGPGGAVLKVFGFKPSRMNPNFCANCLEQLPPGGAEVDIAVLFADVRGSTAMGETLDARAFAARLNRFYQIATDVLLSHDALIDKLIGDEVMALFVRGVAGADYRKRACDAGVQLLTRIAREPEDMRLPIGVAVHAGPAYVGVVGGEGVVDFTALGDTVNTAARMQSLASPGQLVVSEELYAANTSILPVGEARTVDIRGRTTPLDVRVLTPAETAATRH